MIRQRCLQFGEPLHKINSVMLNILCPDITPRRQDMANPVPALASLAPNGPDTGMKTTRKRYSADFKVKVALEVI